MQRKPSKYMKPDTSLHPWYLRLSALTASVLIRTGRACAAIVISLGAFEGRSPCLSRKRPQRRCRRRAAIRPQLAVNVFNFAREGIVIADCNGQVINVNEAFTRITGYDEEELVEQGLASDGILMRKMAAFCSSMSRALTEQGHWAGEVWSSRKDGAELVIKLSVSMVRGSRGEVQHYVALLSDITQLKKQQQLLERRADYDALTQLANRDFLARWMRQSADSVRARCLNLAVAFIDLDGFKAVNDLYGHGFGDRVLQIVAQRIKATIRKNDILARLGGDEFIAGLIDLQQPEDCEPILKCMLQAASAPILIDSITVQISASIGVAFFPLHGQEIETLIGKADQAMYASKRAGGGRLAFCAT